MSNFIRLGALICVLGLTACGSDSEAAGPTGGGAGAGAGGAMSGASAGAQCCTASEAPGCADKSLAECVCAEDDVCCSGSWDGVCVDIATTVCGASCSSGGSATSGGAPGAGGATTGGGEGGSSSAPAGCVAQCELTGGGKGCTCKAACAQQGLMEMECLPSFGDPGTRCTCKVNGKITTANNSDSQSNACYDAAQAASLWQGCQFETATFQLPSN